jgi:hypothetical protein
VILILNGFNQIFPFCIGWMPKTLIGFWMLGSVALTRFGTRSYPDQLPPPEISENQSESESTQSQTTASG